MILALALAEQLLVPLVHHGKVRLKAGQRFHAAALAVQDIAGHGVAIGIVIHAQLAELLAAIGSTLHQRVNVNACAGDGKKAHSGQDGITAADIIGNHKGRPALLGGQLLQRALGAVGGSVDALVGLLDANGILQKLAQHTESEGSLGGGAGLGDDIDGEALALRQLDDVIERGRADGIAAEVDLQAVINLIMVQALNGLYHGAGTQIGAADTGDKQHIRVGTDLLCGLLDAGELLLVISNRQVKPTQKVIAGTGFGFQLLMGQLDLRIDCFIFFRTDEFCKMLTVKSNSHLELLLCYFYIPIIPFSVGIVKQNPGAFFDFFMKFAQNQFCRMRLSASLRRQ